MSTINLKHFFCGLIWPTHGCFSMHTNRILDRFKTLLGGALQHQDNLGIYIERSAHMPSKFS